MLGGPRVPYPIIESDALHRNTISRPTWYKVGVIIYNSKLEQQLRSTLCQPCHSDDVWTRLISTRRASGRSKGLALSARGVTIRVYREHTAWGVGVESCALSLHYIEVGCAPNFLNRRFHTRPGSIWFCYRFRSFNVTIRFLKARVSVKLTVPDKCCLRGHAFLSDCLRPLWMWLTHTGPRCSIECWRSVVDYGP